MPNFEIELYSDTKTLPSKAMREVIASAEVGDEQHHECPTMNRLLARVAPMLGQEAAMFMPSGTMANEIAVLMHCQPGDEIYGHHQAHLFNSEGGAPSALAGATIKGLPGARGIYSREALRDAIRRRSKYSPRSRLVTIEQTSNDAGGTVWSLPEMKSVVDEARTHGLKLHMDGARLMNAAIASGISPAEFAGMFDSVYLDFTKGLGCPLGAILAGSQELIDGAWFWKQRLGGSMRQAGLMAAACLWALDHNIERLAEDHEKARRLAAALSKIDGISVEPVETNMVYFDVAAVGVTPDVFVAKLKERGTRAGIHGKTRLRFVTHLSVTQEQVDRAAVIVAEVVHALRR
jgi:threonine aldolase